MMGKSWLMFAILMYDLKLNTFKNLLMRDLKIQCQEDSSVRTMLQV